MAFWTFFLQEYIKPQTARQYESMEMMLDSVSVLLFFHLRYLQATASFSTLDISSDLAGVGVDEISLLHCNSKEFHFLAFLAFPEQY